MSRRAATTRSTPAPVRTVPRTKDLALTTITHRTFLDQDIPAIRHPLPVPSVFICHRSPAYAPGMTVPDLQHLSAADAATKFDEILRAYVAIYAASQTEEDFANFRARGSTQFQGKGFELVTARQGSKLIGFAYGLTLRAGSTWWRGLTPKPQEGFAEETGDRSFAVIELGVLPQDRGKGLGRRLLNELLNDRHEERATLATDPRAAETQRMYERWGWLKAGRVPAASDAPVQHFDLYVLPLHPLP